MNLNQRANHGSTIAAAFTIGTALVLPLMLLEVRNSDAPWRHVSGNPSFGVLLLLAMAFVMTATPVVRAFRSDGAVLLRRPALLVRVTILVLLGAMWWVIVSDQWPCFIGTPNCD